MANLTKTEIEKRAAALKEQLESLTSELEELKEALTSAEAK